MRIFFTVGLVLFCLIPSFSQRYAVANGDWNSTSTWSTSSGGSSGASVPTASDDVYTNGFSVTVDSDVSCKNLNIRRDVANGLVISDGSFATVTVYGQLTGVTNTGSLSPPTTTVLTMGEFESIVLSGSGQKIGAWQYVCPITNLTVDPGAGNTATALNGVRIGTSGTLTILSGTFQTTTLSNLKQLRGSSTSTLLISAGATLNTLSAINGGGSGTSDDPTSRFGTIQLDGTLITSSYVNSTNFSMGANGLLQTSYNNATDQTEGWWYQTNRPTGGTITSGATVEYNAGADQSIYTRSYSNLKLSGSGNKTLSNSASLTAKDLTISTTFLSDNATGINISGKLTNDGTWSPADLVTFNGTGSQSIEGSSATTFGGGITVNKSGGTLTLNNDITVSGALTITAGTINLNSQNISLGGNLVNNGTITPSSSTLAITGTTLVSGSSTTTLNNLFINSTRSFTANAGLTISGTLTNSGSFICPSAANVNINGALVNNATASLTHNNGTITFGGSSTQNISGSGTLSLYNISANNSVNNNGTIQLNGVLTVANSATFDADGSGSGSLTVMSAAQNSGGSIATLSNTNSFSGNVTIQRYINSTEDWRYLSYPIKNGGTVASWQDDFPVTGFSGESCTADGTTIVDCSAASIYEYNAATQQYVAVSGSTYAGTALSSRKGYSVYAYTTNSKTVDVTGNIEAGDVPISLSTSYNLIPNPYPSPIDWDLVNRTGTDNTVYMTTAQGSYASYVAGGGACTGCSFNTGWRGEIAIGQSFWINNTSASTLTFQEDDKVSSATYVREGGDAGNYFRIILSSGAQVDDAIVSFRKGTKGDYDLGVDALKRKNGYFDSNTGRNSFINISTFSSDPAVDLAINAMSPVQCNGSIKLKVDDLPEGTHTLKFTELQNLTLGYTLRLKDNFTSTTTEIKNDGEYEFQVTANAASTGSGRFEILFNSPAIDLNRNLNPTSQFDCSNTMVKLSISNLQPGVQYLFKLNDQALHTPVTADNSDGTILVSKSLLGFGANKLSLTASTLDGCNAKIFNDALVVNFAQVNEVSAVTGGKSCGTGTVTLTASGAALDGHYNWYTDLNAATAIAGVSTASFTTPSLDISKVYYVTAVNANGCESSLRKPVEATIVNVPTPVMTVEGSTLQVNTTSGIQWLKNGIAIEGETNPTYKVTATGTYSVRVTVNGCTATSSAREFIINGIESKDQAFGFGVFPNPASSYVIVSGPVKNADQIQMFDTKGSAVSLSPENMVIENDKTTIDIQKMKHGLYVINVVLADKVVQFKVLKK